MPTAKQKQVVYLFGAGATHAEISNLYPDEDLDEKRGLLIGHVSSRVIERARRDPRYLKNVEMVSGTSGSLNIELLVSLLESSKIHGWAAKTARLKNLVEHDIKAVLKKSLTKRFFLHKALLEFHELPVVRSKEELLALISLNYDDVLDQAYKELIFKQINYSFSLRTDLPSSSKLPLLKLHGSFNWKNQQILGNRRTVEIIPVGSSKSYLHAPYGFIWNRALDSLSD